MTASRKKRLGVFKLASCDGCQLTLLDMEDELLSLVEGVEIAYFAEATSRPDDGKPFDLAIVEGSVSAPFQVDEVRALRARTPHLVAIGACASAGGIQALRNWADSEEYRRVVYAKPEYVATLARSQPVSDFVPVDFELAGCPIDKRQLLEVITAFLVGRKPQIPAESVCMQCKRDLNVCVMVAHGQACLGPVTQAGCGALCPGKLRGCYGCFGPKENPNTASLANWFADEQGVPQDELKRKFRHIYNSAGPFRDESKRHGDG